MIESLIKAGPITRIVRVGYAPFEGDDPIEITFESGAVFNIDIGFEGATDIVVREGTLLETAYGHLRSDEPDAFKAIQRDWSSEDIELPWLIGAELKNPRRLAMTNPYRVDVGYVFDVNGRDFALFGEADFISANELDDEDNEGLGLEVGAPYSAA
ncbi:hypothetical protein [Candidatus Viadribacter manganicus]|uniref:Uncharacterized protein n=1 Tax=Candidatus Viadribacter manganicus TaxID=1759059 RepID=A0A1B1AI86_9PROT|nr:hypothetical protein [Candidatus Viadribacter manganicus]ANP46265.1 hypothetical protein ATE48_10225 [Candidatus Viadribacter manganicus]